MADESVPQKQRPSPNQGLPIAYAIVAAACIIQWTETAFWQMHRTDVAAWADVYREVLRFTPAVCFLGIVLCHLGQLVRRR